MRRDRYTTYFVIAVPDKSPCDFPNCGEAIPIAKDVADHQAKKHGIDNQSRLTDLAAVGRMYLNMLNDKFADEARVLNFLNRVIARLEARLAKQETRFESSHGWDITGLWYDTGHLEQTGQATAKAPRAAQVSFVAQGLVCIRAHALQEGQLPSGGMGSRVELTTELQSLRNGAEDAETAAEDGQLCAELDDLILTFPNEPGLTSCRGFMRYTELVHELKGLYLIFRGD